MAKVAVVAHSRKTLGGGLRELRAVLAREGVTEPLRYEVAARLLGARHLIQAVVSFLAPLPGVLAAGAAIDAVHVTSMVMLAAADRGARRAAMTDALAESVFAAAGLSAAGRASPRL